MDHPHRPQGPEKEGNPLELIAIPRKSVIYPSLSLSFYYVWLILCQICTVLRKDLSLSSRLNCKWNDSHSSHRIRCCPNFFSPTLPPQGLLNLCHSAIKPAPGLPQPHRCCSRSRISTFHFHLNVIPIHYLTFELHPLKVPCISARECSFPRL